ncbi:AAA domain-containing protein [Arthrobacter sp. RCC_34]|uniref:AAA domain-containing protein n=1 Tax=Arthrobacter sp. RCC_34 TaxID=3239230 RepID=UPI003523985D
MQARVFGRRQDAWSFNGFEEAILVDPRSALVLTRKDPKSRWSDSTHEVDSFAIGASKITLTFVPKHAGSPRIAYSYSRVRAAVCAPGTPILVPDQHVVLVRGVLWSSAPEIFEFDGPDGRLRKLFWTSRDGIEKTCWYEAEDVVIMADATYRSAQSSAVLGYFREIIEAKDPESDPIVRAYRSFDFVHPESVLARYLSGGLPSPRSAPAKRVYPFRSNLSQQEATEKALTHQISVIEGPPGTGKTETILNLIANIVVNDLGSVAVVSLSNSAVENVGEKLQEYGFGHIVAELGNRTKQEAFFAGQRQRNEAAVAFAHCSPPAPDPTQLAELDERLRALQAMERERAQARALLAEYRLEYDHFRRRCDDEKSVSVDSLPLLRRPTSRILEFLAESSLEMEFGYRPGLIGRVRKFFKYGRIRDIDPADVETVLALQSAYYQKRIAELVSDIARLDGELDGSDFEEVARQRQLRSLETFAASLASRVGQGGRADFTPDSLRHATSFRSLVHEYPLVLSTCHSLRRNIPAGNLFDYLIIDEASQVDLLSASLAMSVCRNLVIVGDRKQLPQISSMPEGALPAPSPPYDYVEQSILSSLQFLYGEAVPVTLLREHYRCHPAIIGFCNRAFYDGQLIPYTSSDGRAAPAMRVHPTARGNHMRQHRGGGKSNQREIDVVLQEVLPAAPPGTRLEDIAFAAPYRQQADKAAAQLSDQMDTVDTVHRLQGRQKRMVVLTTVLSETWQGLRGLQFVDDPRLINVAVSRAIDTFVLVTNFDQLPKSRHIRDLIGYIEYHYPDQAVEPSAVVSVFDLLYRDFDAQLAPLAGRLSSTAKYRSEEIIRVLIGDILAEPAHGHLRLQEQVFLKNLVARGTSLNDEQRAFVRRTSSVDFVVYNTVTQLPQLAIEVDGFAWHENNPAQLRRDRVKDSVLQRVGLPLLRLRTTESGEEDRIRGALAASARV